jgi:indolepyruvate ferredoxin oxidoreductase alpha subunit
MKHVGLNVAADAFVNSALVGTHGGLVLAVADDPGMHSSQNEQDSRFYADFARVPCLEPADQQEAYAMTREAFEWSERFAVPVVLRLVTRLAHSRTTVVLAEPRGETPIRKAPRRESWILLPGNARRQLAELVGRQGAIAAAVEASPWNRLTLEEGDGGLGVITTGIARNYLRESLDELVVRPSHLHIGAYPVPTELVRRLAARVSRVLVLEDGAPFVERPLRGLLASPLAVAGRMSGEVPATGELTPDVVRAALGLAPRPSLRVEGLTIPARPPQLCQGCPHGHAYHALQRALEGIEGASVTSDIGCYTLGALPPVRASESCVCMGASIGMARGAAEAGLHPVVAVIGDSTFLHSGIPALIDAAAARANMTLLVLDNQTVGMTGAQEPLVGPERLESVVRGAGVAPEHVHVLDAHPRKVDANARVIRAEIEHRGLSVIIARRECKEIARRHARAAAKSQESRHGARAEPAMDPAS